MKVYFPGGKRVYADYGEYTIETDQPARGGGDDSAPAPFDLFLASIGTCAGIFALGFMQQRGIDPDGLEHRDVAAVRPGGRADHEDRPRAEASGRGSRRSTSAAVVNAMNLCTVKKHLHQPPEFTITTSDGLTWPTSSIPPHAQEPRGPLPAGGAAPGGGRRAAAAGRRRDRGGLRRRHRHLHDGRGGGRAARQGLRRRGAAAARRSGCARRSPRSLSDRLCVVRDRRQRGPRRRRRGRPRGDGGRAAPPVRPAGGARRGRPRAAAAAACSWSWTGATRSAR